MITHTSALIIPHILREPNSIIVYYLTTLAQTTTKVGKYQPKMIRPCDWTFQTKVIIVYDSSFRKPISIVYCLSFLQPTTHKAC